MPSLLNPFHHIVTSFLMNLSADSIAHFLSSDAASFPFQTNTLFAAAASIKKQSPDKS